MRSKRTSLPKDTKGKLYFAISDVSNLLKVSPSTLRMWENMGLILPDRTTGGHRVYSLEKVERLKYIQRLRTEKKLNVEAIRQVLGTNEALNRTKSNTSASGISISRRLHRLRRQRGMTLSEAAAGTDLSMRFLSSLARGHVDASMATLQKLALFYKTKVQSFFGNIKNPR